MSIDYKGTRQLCSYLSVAVLDFKNWRGKYGAYQNNVRTFFYFLQLLYYIMYTSYIITIIYFTKAY